MKQINGTHISHQSLIRMDPMLYQMHMNLLFLQHPNSNYSSLGLVCIHAAYAAIGYPFMDLEEKQHYK